MPPLVCMGATIKCSFGVAPSSLMVIPTGPPAMAGSLAATIMDHKPMANIMPFGMCITQSNPMVAAATAAALGTPTPAPCIPVTASPWKPGATKTKINGSPALHSGCTAQCNWGGVITVAAPGGNMKVQVT